MRFNKYLQSIADAYRMDYLSSTDEKDHIERHDVWTNDKVPQIVAHKPTYLHVLTRVLF